MQAVVTDARRSLPRDVSALLHTVVTHLYLVVCDTDARPARRGLAFFETWDPGLTDCQFCEIGTAVLLGRGKRAAKKSGG